MIILDTNVLSEPLKIDGSKAVAAWLNAQPPEILFTTTINLAELFLGAALLPLGQRRSKLEAGINRAVSAFGETRVLTFTAPAARMFAVLVAQARAAGRAIAIADGQIAAIAAVHGFTVATRDTEPFIAAGVPIINPWQAT